MINLYVYDFDKTLIPYDSLNRFIRLLLRRKPIRVGWIVGLRVMRIISATEMKRRINQLVLRDNQLLNTAQSYAKQIASEVIWPKEEGERGNRLIISASPVCYMQFVAQEIGCEIVASGVDEKGQFVNMYAEAKLNYLQMHYPQTEYTWQYAASDSSSDLCWMEKFNEFEIIK